MGKTFKDSRRQYGTERSIRQGSREDHWAEIEQEPVGLSDIELDDYLRQMKPLDKNDRNVRSSSSR